MIVFVESGLEFYSRIQCIQYIIVIGREPTFLRLKSENLVFEPLFLAILGASNKIPNLYFIYNFLSHLTKRFLLDPPKLFPESGLLIKVTSLVVDFFDDRAVIGDKPAEG